MPKAIQQGGYKRRCKRDRYEQDKLWKSSLIFLWKNETIALAIDHFRPKGRSFHEQLHIFKLSTKNEPASTTMWASAGWPIPEINDLTCICLIYRSLHLLSQSYQLIHRRHDSLVLLRSSKAFPHQLCLTWVNYSTLLV